jgi:replicative DNA helicase
MNTTEIEREIVGSILKDPTLYADIRHLDASDFADDQLALVWSAIKSAASQGLQITPRAIAASSFDIDQSELARLARDAAANVDAVRRTAQRLSSERRRERAIVMLRDTVTAIEREPERWESLMSGVTADIGASVMTRRAVPAAEMRERLAMRIAQGARAAKIPTGLGALDNELGGGLPPSTLIMIGAFGKSGKTTLTATISYNFERMQIPHIVFELERDAEHIEALKVARDLHINAIDLTRHARLPESDGQRYCDYVHGTALTDEMIRHEILWHVRHKGGRAALIDFWQLIEGRTQRETFEQFRGRVAQTIQKTAVDAQIPIVMTYQIGSGPDNKEIQAARTAANLCMFLHRDRNDVNAWLENIATNISSEEDFGGIGKPALILDRDAGPHFKDPNALP